MTKNQLFEDSGFHVKVNIEPITDRGYLRIPFELFALKIPQKGGGERSITLSEVHVLAFLMQFSDGKFTIRQIAGRLLLRMTTVRIVIKNLTNAGLLELSYKE